MREFHPACGDLDSTSVILDKQASLFEPTIIPLLERIVNEYKFWQRALSPRDVWPLGEHDSIESSFHQIELRLKSI